MKETDLYAPVKAWLEHGGHTVYSEVQPKRFTSRRADVFATHGSIDTVIELKTSLSLTLLDQCAGWGQYAHLVYAAVPAPSRYLYGHLLNRYVPELGIKVMRDHGIGLLYVDGDKVYNVLRARLNRRIEPILRDSLTEYHLTHSPDAGTNAGGHITPYRVTMLRVREFLEKMHDIYDRDSYSLRVVDGWVTIDQILSKCETHYSSPKPSTVAALQNYESDWCETKVEGRKRYFRCKPDMVTPKKEWWA